MKISETIGFAIGTIAPVLAKGIELAAKALEVVGADHRITFPTKIEGLSRIVEIVVEFNRPISLPTRELGSVRENDTETEKAESYGSFVVDPFWIAKMESPDREFTVKMQKARSKDQNGVLIVEKIALDWDEDTGYYATGEPPDRAVIQWNPFKAAEALRTDDRPF